MKHEADQWEKQIRKGPFAAAPFTEEHKHKVLQQVEWIRTASSEEKKINPLQSAWRRLGPSVRYPDSVTDKTTNIANTSVINTAQNVSSHRRLSKMRKGMFAAGMSAALIAGGLFLWNWEDGEIAKPLMEQLHPASALLFTDHLNVDILTDKMKKNIAITMRDDLGKQLRINKVQDLPVSGRIYVEAGQEKEADYAQIWLDAKTGNLREVQMRAEMQASKLEHRYLRQIPSLLESMGINPTLTPESVRRTVNMKQGENEPTTYTTSPLVNETGYGEITWKQDQAVYIAGEISSDKVSRAALTDAQKSVANFSGKTNLKLLSIHRTKDTELGENTIFFSFDQDYLVQMTEEREGMRYMIRDSHHYDPEIKDIKEMEAYHEKLYNMDESLLREKAGPIIKKIFNTDLHAYKLHRKENALGVVTFELESAKDMFEVEYKDDGRITMISRGAF
ncbi:hypothetical protein HUB98_20345 [Paenibacillus barcinonensis]|uniref:Uncharacterized protein n=1 Tax=Paenibacillus barcinonensis TaxID=198119 RepID=A0A2V4UTB0_PAEBA|nr:hypothetical protein [Paenibacillus barcinonensis]PYE42399.1 hypothetical protein DFQ00_1364 [Paenibacillus barcinonensis]QKS58354.1 hypothetical protein HUB98_20345 [Paenibacillus barcinonensis]